jgi:hypothetical protein
VLNRKIRYGCTLTRCLVVYSVPGEAVSLERKSEIYEPEFYISVHVNHGIRSVIHAINIFYFKIYDIALTEDVSREVESFFIAVAGESCVVERSRVINIKRQRLGSISVGNCPLFFSSMCL